MDWVLLDLEHGEFGEEQIAPLLRALKGSRTKGIVRVPTLASDLIGRVLDRGADGIMVPHVRSAVEAAQVVEAMRYPPHGSRGVSRTVRAWRYGMREFADGPVEAPVFLAQIEDPEGVASAAEIALVDGVTALFVGPADLQHSLGHATSAPGYDDCLASVVSAASDAGIASGILTRDTTTLSSLAESGFRWIAVGSDLGFLRTSYQKLTSQLGRKS